MESQRNFLIAMVLSIGVLLGWSLLSEKLWPTALPARPAATAPAATSAPAPAAGTVATPAAAPAGVPGQAAAAGLRDRGSVLAATQRVRFANDKVEGSVNLTGARVDDLVLKGYREALDKKSPAVRLLSPEGAAKAYYAGFGWNGDGVEVPGAQTVWVADRDTLKPGQPVTLTWANASGQQFALRIALDDKYMFSVEQTVANRAATPVTVRPFGYIARSGKSPDPSTFNAHVGPMGVFNGKADYSIDWDDLDKAGQGGQRFSTPGGWLGMTDHYWLTALVPAGTQTLDAGFRQVGGVYQADYAAPSVTLAPGRQATAQTRFYAGAKEAHALDAYESAGIPLFSKAIDWGWYEIIEKPIFRYLSWLFDLTKNFGVAIILLVVTVRLLMFPIAQRQFASMAAMKSVQPKVKALQERYKDDKPKLQQEMLALYKAEKINPLAGCLPILIQIPIFFALYKVLILSTEMRHQPFALWIKDLSAADPLTPVNLFGLLPFTPPAFLAIGVLPILVGVTQYLQFKLNPQPMDPTQEQVFKLMPWVLMFVMAPFAAGLQLYWLMSNVLSILQQRWLYSRHPALAPDPKTA